MNSLVSASPLPPAPDLAGVAVDFSKVPLAVNPLLAGIKSLNRIEQVLAAAELGPSLFEVIMADRDGNLVEGTRTNLLLRQADTSRRFCSERQTRLGITAWAARRRATSTTSSCRLPHRRPPWRPQR